MNRNIPAFVLAVLLGAGGAAFAQGGGASSLSAMDYVEIQQLYARYNYAIDAGDVEGYVALYTPDGAFNNFEGTEGLRTFMKNRQGGLRRHWNTNLVITPSPEGARGQVYLMFVDVGTKSITGAGKYEDTLVKTAQGWRFKKRRTMPDPPAAAPAAPQK